MKYTMSVIKVANVSERDFNRYTIKFLFWALVLMLLGLTLVKAGII